MTSKKQVLVTGKQDHWVSPEGVDFNFLEVLEFKGLPISNADWSTIEEKPFDWILFTSKRSVRFWTEALLLQGIDFPIHTKVACIGEKTSEAAEMDGYTPDFYPSSPGTENFLKEFKTLLPKNTSLRILLPGSAISRPLLREKLSEMGCEVTFIPTYETQAKTNLREIVNETLLEKASLFLFTSPSSVEAVCSQVQIPASLKIAAIGSFTKESLEKRGFINPPVLSEGNEERVGELLC